MQRAESQVERHEGSGGALNNTEKQRKLFFNSLLNEHFPSKENKKGRLNEPPLLF